MLDRREQDIVTKAQSGDKHAFGELVERYQNLVTSIAFSRTGDLQRSEDIAQQVFLIAWKKRSELRQPARFGGWLRSITRHVTLNSNRKSVRLDRSATTLVDDVEQSNVGTPTDAMARREQQELLWSSLHNIPEKYREPLILFYRQDQSVRQVAEQLGLSVDTVKQRLARGRNMLKSEVEQFVEDLLGSTKPTASFAPAVLAALPSVSAATTQVAVKSGFLIGVKSMLGKLGFIGFGTFAGVMGGVLGGVVGVWGAWFGTRAAAKYATSEEERKLLWWFFRTITGMTAVFTAAAITAALLLAEQAVFGFVVVSTLIYSGILAVMIVSLINRQKSLHEIHGKPNYPEAIDQGSPQSPTAFRLASLGSTFGCWAWVFMMSAVDQDWLVLCLAIAIMLGHFAWQWLHATVQMTLPQQMRFQAKSMLSNAALAGILVSAAGFLGSRLNMGSVPNWSVAIGVFIILSLVAGGIWFAAHKTEQKIATAK